MKPLIADLSAVNRGVGIEIEMALPSPHRLNEQERLAAILTRNELPAIARGYSDSLFSPQFVLAIECDSTISDPPVFVRGQRVTGVSFAQIELKTKILRSVEEYEWIVPKAIGICKALGARASGGLHVHISVDESNRDPSRIKSAYNLTHRFDKVLFGLQPASRASSDYSKPLPDQPRLLHKCRSRNSYRRALEHLDRSHSVNFTHLWEPNPHVEFRHAASSLNPQKVTGWTFLCLQLVEHAMRRNCQAARQKIPNTRKGLESFFVTCGYKSCSGIYERVKDPRIIATRKWMIRRWKQLNQHSSS